MWLLFSGGPPAASTCTVANKQPAAPCRLGSRGGPRGIQYKNYISMCLSVNDADQGAISAILPFLPTYTNIIMPTPKYYLGPMGTLYHSSGEPVDCRPLPEGKLDSRRYFLRKLESEMLREQGILSRPRDIKGKGKEVDYVQTGTSTQDSGSNAGYQSDFVSAAVEANLAIREKTYPDGPWLRSPDEIRRPGTVKDLTEGMRDDITVEEHRELYRKMVRHLIDSKIVPHTVRTIKIPGAVDMATAEWREDPDLVDLRIEQWFVNAPMYLVPGAARTPLMLERLGEDWRWNARGVYYRHYFSPEWVTADHELWVPTVQGVDWRDPTEDGRRDRAKRLLKHAFG